MVHDVVVEIYKGEYNETKVKASELKKLKIYSEKGKVAHNQCRFYVFAKGSALIMYCEDLFLILPIEHHVFLERLEDIYLELSIKIDLTIQQITYLLTEYLPKKLRKLFKPKKK